MIFRDCSTTPVPASSHNFVPNLLLIVLGIAAAILIAEVYTRLYWVESSGWSFTLGSKSWASRYWNPINSMGFRDDECVQEASDKRKLAYVIGDSFAAGQGINNYKDRFSNQLQLLIGTTFKVCNMAQPGWNTLAELKLLSQLSKFPDVLLLSYFPNDIQDAADEANLRSPETSIQGPVGALGTVVESSYLANRLYWGIYKLSTPYYGESYWRFLQSAFAHPQVWHIHEAQLTKVVEYASEKKATLVVVIFPQLLDLAGSIDITTQVERFFSSRGVPVINMAHELRHLPSEKLIVGPLDAHPSKFVHHKVAELAALRWLPIWELAEIR